MTRQLESVNLSFGGYERHSLLHTPDGWDGKTSLPLVLMLHGAGGSASATARDYGWVQKANTEQFFVFFPESLAANPSKPAHFVTNPRSWFDGSGTLFENGVTADDVAFIDALLAKLADLIPYDAQRVYIAGFSNGAAMTFAIGAGLSDKIAAIAPVTGHLWVENPAVSQRVPMIYIVGSSDPINPLEGGISRSPWGTMRKRPPILETVMRWVDLVGCSSDETVVIDDGGVKAVRYGSLCLGCRCEVMFYTIEDMGHIWPGGINRLPEEIAGKYSDKINATDVIWEFFSRH